jgi:hypothetical protein
MSDADDTFAKATDSLIALYRGVERSTLDLPLVSFMPVLIFMWAFLRFYMEGTSICRSPLHCGVASNLYATDLV